MKSINSISYSESVFINAERFILEKIEELKSKTYCIDEEIKILIPKWFIDAYGNYLNNNIFNFNYVDNKGSSHIMGHELLPHYKNEIVVYYVRFIDHSTAKYFSIDLEKFLIENK